MKLEHMVRIGCCTALLAVWMPATASLNLRLSGAAYYDDQLNTTFIKDANLSATTSFGLPDINAGGAMTWSTAVTWIGKLNASNYLGYNDWRLPSVKPINGVSFQFNGSYVNGSVDLGYNISAPGTVYSGSTATELPYLFYNDLKDVAAFDSSGNAQSTAANNSGPLRNLLAAPYWTSQLYGASGAIAFDFSNGRQSAFEALPTSVNNGNVFKFYVMPVRTGDVSAVPEPATALLLFAGLAGVISFCNARNMPCLSRP